MDLRREGHPFEKKYIEFTEKDRTKFVETFHNWQTEDGLKQYADKKNYCKSVNKNDLIDYTLVPSKYIEFDKNTIDSDYEFEIKNICEELSELINNDKDSKDSIKKLIGELTNE